MSQKTKKNRKNNKETKKKRTLKNKKGGVQYKHRRVGLFFTEPKTKYTYQINCEVCRNNDYIERLSTLGKTKENQAITDILIGDTIFENWNNISIKTYFCRICGMSKIIRDDDNTYIYPIPIPIK